MNGPPGQGFSVFLSVGLPVLGLGSLAVWAVVADRLRRGEPVVPYEPRRQVPWGAGHVLAVVLTFLAVARLVAQSSALWFPVDRAERGSSPEVAAVTEKEPQRAHPLVIALEAEPGLAAVLVAVAAGAAAAPLSEEFFFRLLLQGWLEKVERRWRRRFAVLRRLALGLLPVLVVSCGFALLHFHKATTIADPRGYLRGVALEAAARLVTLALAVWLLRSTVGATARDLGFVPARFWADVRLGLLAFLAVLVPIYLLQFCLLHVLPKTISPDPISLFFFTLLLGLLYFRTHRIVPSMVLHMALNGTSLAMYLVFQEGW